MFRASIILKNAREDKGLELIDISKKLKVSVKYLSAIEGEQRSNFPAEPYCSLIIKDYANFLGLNGEDVLSLFRRDFASLVKTKSVDPQKLFFTPQFTFKAAVLASILIFGAYLFFEYLKFNRPPVLKINWPATSAMTSSLEITGLTDPDAAVRINSDLVIVDPSGNFEKKVTVTGNSFPVTVESKSPSGKTTVLKKTYSLK